MSHDHTCYRVTVDETGESFVCNPKESALSAFARAGKRGIPVGCRGGGGVCKVEVLHGDFRKRVMSRSHVTEQDEAEPGACLLHFPENRFKGAGAGKDTARDVPQLGMTRTNLRTSNSLGRVVTSSATASTVNSRFTIGSAFRIESYHEGMRVKRDRYWIWRPASVSLLTNSSSPPEAGVAD